VTVELTPTQRDELAKIAGRNGAVAEWTGAEPLTDAFNARLFAQMHGHRFRYVTAWRRWLVAESGRWYRDETGEIARAAKGTARHLYAAAGQIEDPEHRKRLAAHAIKLESEPRLRSMIELAKSEPTIAVAPEQLDADPLLLAAGNGTLELRTGKLREPDPDDLLTRGTDVPFDSDADCPRWRRFLAEVFDSDRELIAFVQRFAGYSLTGLTDEHVLAVLHGTGCNGKSTLVETVRQVIGDYGATAAFDSFSRVRGDRGPRNDLARLHAARMVIAAESSEGRRLDEATIKQLTGGDTVAARFLYGEHFEFVPRFKLWLVTNHRPRVDGADDAIWRRLRLVPFEVSFEGREDRNLRAELDGELPGILRWAVEGCLAWQRDGLGEAAAIEQATREYREDEDVLGAFLAERCEGEGEVETTALREAFEQFCKELGERPPAGNVLGRQLARRGIHRAGSGRRVYRGVTLR
jgi:putative DNA primase/helicase